MPARRTDPAGYLQARRLRHGPTPAEDRLWRYLRGDRLRGVSFRRQHAIGRYVVDFCSPKHRLVIELDGGGHLRQSGPDARRTAALVERGYRVLRFWNDQVMQDIDGVVVTIFDALKLE